MRKKLFLVIDGPDGAGKGTIINMIENFLHARGIPYICTKEPGSPKSEVCKMFRNFVLNPEYNVDPKSELFLYMADRCQHVNEIIIPALEEGKIVLCDRYIDSTVAYQGYGRYMADPFYLEKIKYLNVMATNGLVPDETFFIMVNPKVGLERVYGKKDEDKEFESKTDRIESENIDFHKRVYKGFIDVYDNKGERNIKIFDTTLSTKEESWDKVYGALYIILQKRGII